MDPPHQSGMLCSMRCRVCRFVGFLDRDDYMLSAVGRPLQFGQWYAPLY